MSNDLDEAIELFNEATRERDPLVREGQMLHGLRRLAMSFRSHPAPPPSPSEENGGEGASDCCDPASVPLGRPCKCSVCLGYEAGRHHQASADAATIAGLREKVAALEKAAPCRHPGTITDGGGTRCQHCSTVLGDTPLTTLIERMGAGHRPAPKGER